MSEYKKNETKNGFELRFGMFTDYRLYNKKKKFEIRILHEDPELMHSLYVKIKEWLKNGS